MYLLLAELPQLGKVLPSLCRATLNVLKSGGPYLWERGNY